MNRNTTNHNFRSTSLRATGSARTVLLRMAADQERADRIKALKHDRPDLTWRRIADHVGVTERAASDWQKKGGIEYENAKKLAEIFEVDTDYIWRGVPPTAPDPFAPAGKDDRMVEMEARLLGQADVIKGLLDTQNQLLARQSRVLERIEAAVAEQQNLKAETDELRPLIAELLAGQSPTEATTPPATPRRKPRAKT